MGYKYIKNKLPLSGFYISFFGSTMNERKGIYGISHLMEHLLCKGLDPYMNSLEQDGISWNAYTSSREILFYMTGLEKNVKKWRKLFYEKISNFGVTEEQFLNEKKIVIEEYKDSFNDQVAWHFDNLFRKLYNKYDSIGLLEDLENLTFEDCKNFFELQYSKPNYIVDISKRKDEDLSKYFESLEYSNNMYENEIVEFKLNEDFIYQKGNDYKDKSSILILLKNVIDGDNAYVDFISHMLSGGLKSPLYQEVREKRGLVYYIWSYQKDITNRSSVALIQTETSKENSKEVVDVILSIINNPKRYMTKKRFNIVKKYYKIYYEKENIMLHNNGHKFVTPENFLLEKILKDITYEKVMEVYNKYFKDFYVSIDSEEFKNELLRH